MWKSLTNCKVSVRPERRGHPTALRIRKTSLGGPRETVFLHCELEKPGIQKKVQIAIITLFGLWTNLHKSTIFYLHSTQNLPWDSHTRSLPTAQQSFEKGITPPSFDGGGNSSGAGRPNNRAEPSKHPESPFRPQPKYQQMLLLPDVCGEDWRRQQGLPSQACPDPHPRRLQWSLAAQWPLHPVSGWYGPFSYRETGSGDLLVARATAMLETTGRWSVVAFHLLRSSGVEKGRSPKGGSGWRCDCQWHASAPSALGLAASCLSPRGEGEGRHRVKRSTRAARRGNEWAGRSRGRLRGGRQAVKESEKGQCEAGSVSGRGRGAGPGWGGTIEWLLLGGDCFAGFLAPCGLSSEVRTPHSGACYPLGSRTAQSFSPRHKP
jgi:hypothetical protein